MFCYKCWEEPRCLIEREPRELSPVKKLNIRLGKRTKAEVLPLFTKDSAKVTFFTVLET